MRFDPIVVGVVLIFSALALAGLWIVFIGHFATLSRLPGV